MWLIVSDRRTATFVLASIRLRAGARFEPAAAVVGYPMVAVEGRVQLPGSFGNALYLKLAYAPRLVATAVNARAEHLVAARADLSLRLGSVGGLVLSARAELKGEWTSVAGVKGVAGLGFDLDKSWGRPTCSECEPVR